MAQRAHLLRLWFPFPSATARFLWELCASSPRLYGGEQTLLELVICIWIQENNLLGFFPWENTPRYRFSSSQASQFQYLTERPSFLQASESNNLGTVSPPPFHPKRSCLLDGLSQILTALIWIPFSVTAFFPGSHSWLVFWIPASWTHIRLHGLMLRAQPRADSSDDRVMEKTGTFCVFINALSFVVLFDCCGE